MRDSKFVKAGPNLAVSTAFSKVLTDVLRRNVENHSTLNNQKQSIRKKIKDIRKNINAHLDKVEMDLGNDLMTKYNS
jgi:hypothetical protein